MFVNALFAFISSIGVAFAPNISFLAELMIKTYILFLSKVSLNMNGIGDGTGHSSPTKHHIFASFPKYGNDFKLK